MSELTDERQLEREACIADAVAWLADVEGYVSTGDMDPEDFEVYKLAVNSIVKAIRARGNP